MPPSNPNDIQIKPPQTPSQPNIINPQPQATPPPQNPLPTTQPKKKRKFIKWLLLLLILIGIGVAAFFALNKKEDKTVSVTGNQKKDIPVLKIGYLSGPLNKFYPDFQASGDFLEVNNQIFEGLVTYQNKTKIVPQLATGWSNPDSSTWVFDIRPNVKFHTGRVLTNVDVKASLDAAKANTAQELFTSTIKSVETVGSNQVKITTDGPDTILLNKLTTLFIYDTKSDKKNDPINGTGPYTAKDATSLKEDNLTFTAFDNYHGGHVSTRQLNMVWHKEINNLVTEFNKGNVDIAGFLDKATMEQLKNYEVYNVSPQGTRLVLTNNSKAGSPLQKLQFRQGLEYLVDKKAIMDAEQGGGEIASQIIPLEIPGYNPSVKSPVRNVTKAKELITAAGYPNGTSLSLVYSSIDPAVIKKLQDQFAEGGVKLTVQDIEDFDAFLARVEKGDFDLALQSYVSDFQDGSDFLKYIKTYARYTNATVDTLLDEASKTIDQTKRLDSLKKASQQVATDAAILPIYYLRDNYALKKGQNYIYQQDTTQTLTQAYYWKVYQKI